MAVVTPFGDLNLRDEIALKRWLAAHHARHQVYVQRGLGKGGTLEGPVDGDWMLRHTARHISLARFVVKDWRDKLTTLNASGLALPGVWKTEQQLQDWHLLHNRLHSLIDRVAGIGGHTARHGPPIRPPP